METIASLRVLLLPSPANFKGADAVKGHLKKVYPTIQVTFPSSVTHLADTVRNSVDRFQILLVFGGDGTINRVINAMDIKSQRLAILPGGRGNDLARALGLPNSVEECLVNFTELKPKRIDLGMAGNLRFHNSAGFGIDATVLRCMKRFSGIWRRNYTLSFLRALPSLKPMRITCDEFQTMNSQPCWWFSVMNSKFIGGGTPVAPRALIDDGKLDVMAVSTGSKFRLLTRLPLVLAGRHLGLEEVEFVQAQEIRVDNLSAPLEIALDGELYEWREPRMEFSVLPGALTVLA